MGDSADVCSNTVCYTVTNGAAGWYSCAESLTGLYFGLCKTDEDVLTIREVMAFSEYYVNNFEGYGGNDIHQYPGSSASNAMQKEFSLNYDLTQTEAASWTGASIADNTALKDHLMIELRGQIYITQVLVLPLYGYEQNLLIAPRFYNQQGAYDSSLNQAYDQISGDAGVSPLLDINNAVHWFYVLKQNWEDPLSLIHVGLLTDCDCAKSSFRQQDFS